jgi:hypothetical protein
MRPDWAGGGAGVRATKPQAHGSWYSQTCMKSDERNCGNGLGSLKSEMDAAFAAVQQATAHSPYREGARTLALDHVTKIAAMVKIALEEQDRSEGEKRLLQAKLRALMEAAQRIPSG